MLLVRQRQDYARNGQKCHPKRCTQASLFTALSFPPKLIHICRREYASALLFLLVGGAGQCEKRTSRGAYGISQTSTGSKSEPVDVLNVSASPRSGSLLELARWLISGSQFCWVETRFERRERTSSKPRHLPAGARTHLPRIARETPLGYHLVPASVPFIPLTTPPLRLQEAGLLAHPDSPPTLCAQHSAPGAPPHGRCDGSWRSGATTPLARPFGPPGAIRNGES